MSISSISSNTLLPIAVEAAAVDREAAFVAYRQKSWTVLSENFAIAKKILEDLSLGWDVLAQLKRGAGLALLDSIEKKQKPMIELAANEGELLSRLQHIKEITIPKLILAVPAGESFQSLAQFLRDGMPPVMENLLRECSH